jgi:hypothetical protein
MLPIPQKEVAVVRNFCHRFLGIRAVIVNHDLTKRNGRCVEFILVTPENYHILVCDGKVLGYKPGEGKPFIYL